MGGVFVLQMRELSKIELSGRGDQEDQELEFQLLVIWALTLLRFLTSELQWPHVAFERGRAELFLLGDHRSTFGSEGEQDLLHPNTPLWHKDDFRLIIFKKQQTTEKL